MAGRRAIKPINWSALAEFVPEREKNNFVAFRAKSDQYLRRVNENPESPPKINWSFYKANIGVPGLVDKFQKEYEALKIEYPQDKYTSQLDAVEKKILASIQEFIQESNQRIEESKAEIERLSGLIKYDQMTMEDFRDAHPELALDPINRPTIWPHTSEYQPDDEDNSPKGDPLR